MDPKRNHEKYREREKLVIEFLGKGLSPDEIAKLLGVTAMTIRAHRRSLNMLDPVRVARGKKGRKTMQGRKDERDIG